MSTEAGAYATVVSASILIGKGAGRPLDEEAEERLVRTVVDASLHLPGMFELTFFDRSLDILTVAGLSIGTVVQVWGGGLGDGSGVLLLSGEITSLEGRFERGGRYTIVRGYDLGHRLQRARRTRTFVNMTDSDIASRLAREAGLTESQVEPSGTAHVHIGQCDQTDWDFLTQRAREIGYELAAGDGVFRFRKASTTTGGTPVALGYGENLWEFRPRVTAGNLTPEVEVRVWDQLQAKVIAHTKPTSSGAATITGTEPAALARTFAGTPTAPDPPAERSPAVGDLGPAPSATAHVLYDRPLAVGAAITSAGEQVAGALAEHLASTFAEADGEAEGTPGITAGGVVKISGVPTPFQGSWLVTGVQHVWDLAEGGYLTRFVASGRQERSLLGLTSIGGTTRSAPARLPGVYCAVVTNNNDPQQKARVKVALPWLSPDYESDWASVVQFGAGKASGAMFLPEVGDEVLVGFEFADPRRPYVFGGIVNNTTGFSLGAPPIKSTGMVGQVVRRGFVSGAGNRLVFHDEVPPGDDKAPPTASDIVLGTGDGSLGLAIDQTAGTITLTCKPSPPNSKTPTGSLTIECGDAGVVNIKTGEGGSVTIDGGSTLTLKSQESVTIQSTGQVAIKGETITLN
ncbi:MAG TPA: phage baseplate assembly protein V [Pseudonocardiaceae bacterium]|nr:phage baseplate assembly protein V [Pseudonocardiaceae bacterium]